MLRSLSSLLLLLLLGSACASSPHGSVHIQPHPTADRPGLIYFAHITDTHQGPGLHQWRFSQAIDLINHSSLPLACVFHTGDFASNGLQRRETAATIAERLHQLQPPVLTAPGNHDILLRSPRTAPSAIQNFQDLFGPLGQRFETNGVVFLSLYTEPLRSTQKYPFLSFDPLDWLRDNLRASGNKPVIIATHTPSGADYYQGKPQPGWPDEQREKWVNTLAEGNVIAILCGHFHRDEIHWDERGIPTYVASSIAGFWGRQGSFRIYEFDPSTQRLGYRTLYLGDPSEP